MNSRPVKPVTLLGRKSECAQLSSLLKQAHEGSSAICVLKGEAGIGKSSLLDYAASQASGFLVLRGQGVVTESEISYAVLGDLVAPLVQHLPCLVPVQRAALEGALGLGIPTGSEAFVVSVAVLNLLSAVAGEHPLLILVDDCQWVDRSSLMCLAFVARRLAADPIAAIFAERSWSASVSSPLALAGFPSIKIDRLSLDQARQLALLAAPEISGPETDEILVRAKGNPLATIELAKVGVQTWGPLQSVGLTSHLEATFAKELDRLPLPARRTVEALAVLGDSTCHTLTDFLTAFGLPLSGLDIAERKGLVCADQGVFSFRHPLIQLATYNSMDPALRRELHLAAASMLAGSKGPSDAERWAWHRIAATLTRDESLARTLEGLATTAIARSSAPSAVRLLEKAADFSDPAERGAPRYLAAVEQIKSAGLLGEADRLLNRVLAVAPTPEFLRKVEHLRCRLDTWRGMPIHARDRLLDLAQVARKEAPEEAANMLAYAALTSIWLGDIGIGRTAINDALALVPPDSTPSLSIMACGALIDLVSGNIERGRERLGICHAHMGAVDPLSTEQIPLVIALARFADEDLQNAVSYMEKTVQAARAASALGLLPFQLSWLATMQFAAGRWPAAYASANEAAQLAEHTGWLTELPEALASLAIVEAGLGQVDDCREHAEAALKGARKYGGHILAAQANAALGLLELGLGRPAEAADRFEQVATFAGGHGMAENPILSWVPDLAESYIRLGDRESARPLVDLLAAEAEARGRLRLSAEYKRCRGLLTESSAEAENWFTESIATAWEAKAQFSQARGLLCLGQLYRRQHRKADSRRPLAAAVATFEFLGAAKWLEQAQLELKAAGIPVEPSPVDLAGLSPQELSVSQSVAEGLTNQQIAMKLFISVRTVEFHLSNAYRKLGVSRRAQLLRLLHSRTGS